MRFFFLFFVNILLGSKLLLSQIALYPSAVFIDSKTKTGTFEVYNTSDELREFDLTFKFGYMHFDSLGNGYVEYNDSTAEKSFSLLPYIKAYPTKMIIPPKTSQVVRFVVRGVPDGDKFYWSRVIVATVPPVQQIENTNPEMISASMVIRSEMVGLVAYLNGTNTADINTELTKHYADSTQYNFILSHTLSGNSPFWGWMSYKIIDDKQKEVYSSDQNLALYFSCNHKIQVPNNNLKPGKYTLRLNVTGEREEIAEEFRSSVFKPQIRNYEFTIN